MTSKPTNPKESVGVQKWRQFTCVPAAVQFEIGVAMLEGARKYGRNNWSVAGALASIYVDAALGHIHQWWCGEDVDAESKVSHLTKAITSLMVLRDAEIHGKMSDDRPPKTDLDALRTRLQSAVNDIFSRVPEAKPAHTEAQLVPTSDINLSSIETQNSIIADIVARLTSAELLINDPKYEGSIREKIRAALSTGSPTKREEQV